MKIIFLCWFCSAVSFIFVVKLICNFEVYLEIKTVLVMHFFNILRELKNFVLFVQNK